MIELKKLSKKYRDHFAVNDVSAVVKPGVVTALLGPNGAGKSTLIRLVLGLARPTAGEALVMGKPLSQHSRPASIVGALVDGGGAQPGRSARMHLWSLALAQGVDRRRVDEMIDLVGIGSVAKKPVGSFSLGMNQRLGIAAALLSDPQVVILDEPANGLDVEGIAWVRGLLRDLAMQGRTVLVSSHLMGEVAVVADQVLVIGKGRVVADLTAKDFLGRYARPVAQVKSSDPEKLDGELRRCGAKVSSSAGDVLTVEGLSLQTVGERAFALGVKIHELRAPADAMEEAFMTSVTDLTEYRSVGQGMREMGAVSL